MSNKPIYCIVKKLECDKCEIFKDEKCSLKNYHRTILDNKIKKMSPQLLKDSGL